MTKNELRLLAEELTASKVYLEFGSGNSTLLAVSCHNLEQIVVVESDDSFFHKQINSDPTVKEALISGKLNYQYINVGKTGEWGYPVTSDDVESWPDYHSKAFCLRMNYDLVLVDGRFRIACILQACLKCSEKTRILVHDFFIRPFYFIVLPFLNLVKQVDTFGLFKINIKKVKRNRSLIKGYIEIFQYYPEL